MEKNEIKKIIKTKLIKEFDRLTPETLEKVIEIVKNSNSNSNSEEIYYFVCDNINIEKKKTPAKMSEQQLQDTLLVFGKQLSEQITSTIIDKIKNEILPEALDPIKSDISEMKVRLTNVEDRLTNVETRLSNVEVRLTNVEDRLTNVEEDVKSLKKEANKKGWKI